jgi:hypothetical protein
MVELILQITDPGLRTHIALFLKRPESVAEIYALVWQLTNALAASSQRLGALGGVSSARGSKQQTIRLRPRQAISTPPIPNPI